MLSESGERRNDFPDKLQEASGVVLPKPSDLVYVSILIMKT